MPELEDKLLLIVGAKVVINVALCFGAKVVVNVAVMVERLIAPFCMKSTSIIA